MDFLGLGPIAELGKEILAMFPNAEQRSAAANKLQDFASKVAEQQSATNTAEATNPNWFVSGWRPFCGWAFGAGTIYGVVLQPLLAGLMTIMHLPPPPPVDISTMAGMLSGMLGLGGLRTFEKTTGKAK